MPWRPVAIVLGFITVALLFVAIIQKVALNDALHARLARDQIACQANLAALRRKELVYVAIDKAARKLTSDLEHRSIDTGLGPLLSLVMANADIGLDADYQNVLLKLVLSAYDYRGGAATPEQVEQRADEFLVEGQKAAERTQTLIAAAIPQGC